MHSRVLESVADVPADTWNGLVPGDHPFVKHEFLAALENTGCAAADSGWIPQHMLLFDAGIGSSRLLGALPMYLKTHSYGEYVFDWAWADAYQRAGMQYYPKLLVAIPFTPVTGPRILAASDCDRNGVRRALIEAAHEHAMSLGVSSLHILFTTAADTTLLQGKGFLRRVGTQFQWRNRSFDKFDDYLAAFSSKKRKKIKRERRRVREAGVQMHAIGGDDLSPAHWDTFYRFYRHTISNHYAIPYLSRTFFHEIGQTMSKHVVMILASMDGEYVAGALNLRNRDTMYGRYWGCIREYADLHFETCYYSAIEYAIQHGLTHFEAGAQGEHKLDRGLVPTATYSAHWLRHPQFAGAIAGFLDREALGVDHYMKILDEHTPFRRG